MFPPHSLIQRIAADHQRELRARYDRPRFRDDGSTILAAEHSASLPSHVLTVARRTLGYLGTRTRGLRPTRHAARG